MLEHLTMVGSTYSAILTSSIKTGLLDSSVLYKPVEVTYQVSGSLTGCTLVHGLDGTRGAEGFLLVGSHCRHVVSG